MRYVSYRLRLREIGLGEAAEFVGGGMDQGGEGASCWIDNGVGAGRKG